MKICLVSSSFYPATSYGGPVFSTWNLSVELAKKGYEIYVSTSDANGTDRLKNITKNKFISLNKNLFVKYYKENIINYFSLDFFLNIYSDIKRCDIVYIQYLYNYMVPISLMFSIFLNKKIVLCPRGSFSAFTFSKRNSIIKKIWLSIFIKPFCKKICFHASSILERDDIFNYLPRARVEVISDGVDTKSFSNSNRISKEDIVKKYTNYEFEHVSDIIFSIGRLHYIKGFDILINAFSSFVKQKSNAILIIAGNDDGEKDSLKKQIIALGLEKSIFLIGSVDHDAKSELFSNASFLCLCSRFESFGLVVVEALAAGCPVLVSNKTSWNDIESNNCGIFAENIQNEMTLGMFKMIDNSFSPDNCKKYAECFDCEYTAASFINLINKL
ncbi:MAG: hypothetical protein CMP51_04935 [Flavobacteriales bacterium]|nr:hypothetical protein [Flavobacteriales bacterium]